jgi:ABC-type polysaccharide transport system, permease component
MYGVIISFQDYDVFKGIFNSKFVGLENFKTIFNMPDFLGALRNTIVISVLKLGICFPCTIVFALLVNEINKAWYRKMIQTISYLPYFISWVIAAGIWYKMLSIDNGVINDILMSLHLIKEPYYFVAEKATFYTLIILTDMWKSIGFNAIIYIAALSSINIELYEAAKADGASRFKQIWHISIPGIKSTIVLMFILSVSGLMKAGQDQLWTMGNVTVRSMGEILDTLILRNLKDMGLTGYSTGTAMGIFQAFVGLILFLSCNYLAKLMRTDSII